MTDPVADSLLEHRKKFPALEECVHFISHSLVLLIQWRYSLLNRMPI